MPIALPAGIRPLTRVAAIPADTAARVCTEPVPWRCVSVLPAELLPEFVDGEGWARAVVDHGVAVGADRAKVGDGVDPVPGGEAGKLDEVVDVDVVAAEPTVVFLEREAADGAPVAPVLQACPAGARVALVAVDLHPAHGAFGERQIF